MGLGLGSWVASTPGTSSASRSAGGLDEGAPGVCPACALAGTACCCPCVDPDQRARPLPPASLHPQQGYNPATRKASILYTTGEAEELALDDIVRDGHMSLIQLAPGR